MIATATDGAYADSGLMLQKDKNGYLFINSKMDSAGIGSNFGFYANR